MQFDRLKRREFVTLLGGAAAMPLAARAQQPKGMRQIGVLSGLHEGDPEGRQWVDAFIGALHEHGWKQSENIQIELRWGGGDPTRTKAVAAELVASNPEVIQVSTTLALTAVLQETRAIPVVFAAVSDPFTRGFVSNLARPGGNVTGFLNDEASIGGKHLETPRLKGGIVFPLHEDDPTGGSHGNLHPTARIYRHAR